MRGTMSMSGLNEALNGEFQRLERATTAAMREATTGLKEEMRDRTFAAGLGYRLSGTWQGETYPSSGESLDPSAYVFTKAPKIISSYVGRSRVVTPIGGGFAIPVNPVIGRNGKPLSPYEVERRFNQDFAVRQLRSGNLGLFLNLVRGRSKRRPGFRQATKGRTAQGRRAEMTLMFVVVRQLRTKDLLDLEGPMRRWADRVSGLIDKHLGAGR